MCYRTIMRLIKVPLFAWIVGWCTFLSSPHHRTKVTRLQHSVLGPIIHFPTFVQKSHYTHIKNTNIQLLFTRQLSPHWQLLQLKTVSLHWTNQVDHKMNHKLCIVYTSLVGHFRRTWVHLMCSHVHKKNAESSIRDHSGHRQGPKHPKV